MRRNSPQLRAMAKFFLYVQLCEAHYKTCKQAGCTFGRGYYIPETPR